MFTRRIEYLFGILLFTLTLSKAFAHDVFSMFM